MKVGELISMLEEFHEDTEVRICNVAIEDDEVCPTFQIDDVIEEEGHNGEEYVPVVTIEFQDSTYIQDEYNNTKAP